MNFERSCGILCHITSLPNKMGIGTMGKEAYDFLDFLILTKQKIWQILPLGHTGYGDSPYQCFSAFAGNPLLIDLNKLVSESFLSKNDLNTTEYFSESEVEFGKVIQAKEPILQAAFKNFQAKASKVDRAKFQSFCNESVHWLTDYSLYVALKEHFEGKPWYEWPDDIKLRNSNAIDYYKNELKEKIEFYKVVQYFFFKQWHELKSYANMNNIKIMGDIPLYISYDSADAWSKPELFMFDINRNPIKVAGVPPDYFSETGQLWGNPLYDWQYSRETGFAWWIERIQANFKLYDILRIDHFRGLAGYWAVPYGEKTAQNGEWLDALGMEMFDAVFEKLGQLPIIAEDLGVITPDVEEMRDSFGFPGMKILQFAFDSAEENNFLPHTYSKNCVVYTGTHDNDTCMGWFNSSNPEDRGFLKNYIHNLDEKNFSWELIRLAWASVANIAIAPIQDILSLGNEARMNFPGKASGNWAWRMKNDQLTDQIVGRLKQVTETYFR